MILICSFCGKDLEKPRIKGKRAVCQSCQKESQRLRDVVRQIKKLDFKD